MPETDVRIFQTQPGQAPLLEWLDALSEKVRLKCVARIMRLRALGHELRRPEADYLRDGIYELRVRRGRVDYRMLYFFCGQEAVVSHGLVKEGRVPEREIELAIRRKVGFERDPEEHSYSE